MNSHHDNKPKAIMFMLLSSLSFTIMQAFIKLAVNIPVFEKVFFRNFIGLIFTIILIKRQGLPMFGKRENRRMLVLRGLLGIGGVVTYFYSVSHLPMADASLISKLNPFFVTLFAWIFLKEKLSKVQVPALIATFAGALLVIKPQFSFEVLPALVGFIGAIFAGGAYTVLRLLKGKEHPTTIVFYFCLFSSVLIVPFMMMNFVVPNTNEILLLLGIGVSALIGQYSITYAYKYAPAAEVSIFNYVSIIIAALFGFIIWGEVPDALSILGGAIIVGVALLVWLYDQNLIRRPASNNTNTLE